MRTFAQESEFLFGGFELKISTMNARSKLSWFLLSSVVWSGSWRSGGKEGVLLVLFTQSPWAHRQGAWLGCPLARVGTQFPSGWPWAEEGWWRTWCGGSWCLWPRSQSASSLRSLCPVWCSLLEQNKIKPLAFYLQINESVCSSHKQLSMYSRSPLIMYLSRLGCCSPLQLLKGGRQGYTRS